ncbi:hypothetical protein FOB58_003776 [Candida parapsilosis]|uniref:Uncharacterized protein n=1 Tax=Candida parapsilosis (strain CDC 317 / ATCC MYA-4646) TaxID=578454 RepID=G8B9A5_CANPC|nr:uncharacterized protein CPAR2_301940 [Candida parapsilosis]KAF6047698.1 hypothetical protein FOB58_003776 [Candida parapsilosis]KAF6050334.1 hypothetical protein FOB59_002580 [Candida parapsilosis]KAF6061454.1 hypothetical protein FOB61_004211 [Candida parapsilosis]CCE41205.1 hypothetical protein CPAR2_301940 [Candida parapsilosis]
MPYFKSNLNTTTATTNNNNNTQVTNNKQNRFGGNHYHHHQDTKNYYATGQQNYRYSSFFPGFVTSATHGLPVASPSAAAAAFTTAAPTAVRPIVNTNSSQMTAAKEKNIPQLKSPLHQVPEDEQEDEREYGVRVDNSRQQLQQPSPGFQITDPDFHHPLQKFDIFGCNDDKIPRNLPGDAELEFSRAGHHLHHNNNNDNNNNNSSILQQLQILPPETTIDVYDFLNPRKSANMGYREKIRSWLSSVPLAIAYDEDSTQYFNLNCYPGVVSISDSTTDSDVGVVIDLGDIDDVLELQAQKVTRYVNRLYFNEEEIPLPKGENGENFEEDDLVEEEEEEEEEVDDEEKKKGQEQPVEEYDGRVPQDEEGMLGVEVYHHLYHHQQKQHQQDIASPYKSAHICNNRQVNDTTGNMHPSGAQENRTLSQVEAIYPIRVEPTYTQ